MGGWKLEMRTEDFLEIGNAGTEFQGNLKSSLGMLSAKSLYPSGIRPEKKIGKVTFLI